MDLNEIKSSLREILSFLDPDGSYYQIVKNCSEDYMSAEDMLKEFRSLRNIKSDVPEIPLYFEYMYNAIDSVVKLDKQINDAMDEAQKLNEEIRAEFANRNIPYEIQFVRDNSFLDMTFDQKLNFLEQLRADNETLKDKLKTFEVEKKLGDEFDKKLDEKEVSMGGVLSPNQVSEIDKIQRDASNNYRLIVNPALDVVMNNINFYKDNQSENSVFDLKINYEKSDSVDLEISFKGTSVNEKYPKIVFNFTDVEHFNSEILPHVTNDYAKDGINEVSKNENEITSDNIYGESLTITGNSKYIDTSPVVHYTENFLENSKIDEKVNVLDNSKKLVRTLKFDNKGINNVLIYFIIAFLFIIVICVFILFVFNK